MDVNWQPIDTAHKDGRIIRVARPAYFRGDEGYYVVRWDEWWQVHDGKFDHPLRGDAPTVWAPLDGGEITADMVEKAARAICRDSGYDENYLEPGDIIIHPLDDLTNRTSVEGIPIESLCSKGGPRPPDGYEGEPCHFLWREFIGRAQVALRAALELNEAKS
jgi:hypothetical protein